MDVGKCDCEVNVSDNVSGTGYVSRGSTLDEIMYEISTSVGPLMMCQHILI